MKAWRTSSSGFDDMKKFDTEVHLSREMKLLDVTMIGAGIFVLTGIAAGVANPAQRSCCKKCRRLSARFVHQLVALGGIGVPLFWSPP